MSDYKLVGGIALLGSGGSLAGASTVYLTQAVQYSKIIGEITGTMPPIEVGPGIITLGIGVLTTAAGAAMILTNHEQNIAKNQDSNKEHTR